MIKKIKVLHRNNNINVDTLIRDNSLNNNNLTVGQTLKIRLPIEEEVEECFGKDYIEEVVNNPIYVAGLERGVRPNGD